MVAVDMEALEDVHVDVEEEEEVMCNKQNIMKQVVIYESGKPLLKVEAGTTLEVMKLLYEAECQLSSENIIGVRPRSTHDIPCIVTLQETKLDEITYDLIVKDKKSSTNMSPTERNGHCVTTRCIDCSRESWKSKRYTSVGMNTEISINPLMEIDSLRSMPLQNSFPSNNQPTSDAAYPPRSRGRPPIVQRPVPMAPPHGSIVYSSAHKKDYIVAAVPVIPGTNGVHSHEIEYYDRGHYRKRSPRTSPVQNIHGSGRTQISYPPPPPMSKVEMDGGPTSMHRSPHHAWSHHVVMKAEPSQMSPPRRARSRSPVYPRNGYMKSEPVEYYYPRHSEEARRQHRVRSPGQFPQYEQATSVAALPVHHAERTQDVEPPVYVLPNDFDLKRDRIEPHIVSYHPEKVYVPVERNTLQNGSNLPNGTHQDISTPVERTSPVASDSGKSAEETPSHVAPVERTLSCKICKQNFPTKSTLYKHLRGHTSDEKPFKCNECGQGFTLSSNLRQHRIIHRGYKPFQCEYCGKKFMRSNVYKQHRRIHTGEQMHKCDLCPSEFLQRYALIKHMKKTHNIEALDS